MFYYDIWDIFFYFVNSVWNFLINSCIVIEEFFNEGIVKVIFFYICGFNFFVCIFCGKFVKDNLVNIVMFNFFWIIFKVVVMVEIIYLVWSGMLVCLNILMMGGLYLFLYNMIGLFFKLWIVIEFFL